MKSSSNDWRVECETFGRDGYFFYHEDSRQLPFCWEIGGGDVVGIVRIDEPDKFCLRYPWAIERKREIFERMAQGIIRHAPDCTTEINHEKLCIYVKRLTA